MVADGCPSIYIKDVNGLSIRFYKKKIIEVKQKNQINIPSKG